MRGVDLKKLNPLPVIRHGKGAFVRARNLLINMCDKQAKMMSEAEDLVHWQ